MKNRLEKWMSQEDINMSLHNQMCQLGSEEEAAVIERALRTAVLSVVEVIHSINRDRLHHYHRKVTEKEKENVRLRAELDKAENELALLRQLVNFQHKQNVEESNASTSTQVLDNELNVTLAASSSSCGEDGIVNKLQSIVEQSKQCTEPLSAAERQRRYRARRDADPKRRANYLENEKRRWKRDRELGKRKLIRERSMSEQRVIRRRWRLAKEKSRAANFEFEILSTPQVSPEYLQPQLQEAGHTVDSQFKYLVKETTTAAIQDFDFPINPSELSEYSENNTELMSSSVVKQEPPSTNTVYIKFEVKDENVCTDQNDSCVFEREPPENPFSSPKKGSALGTSNRPACFSTQQTEDIRPPTVSWLKKRNDDRERQRRYRERVRLDPDRLQAYLEKERCRNRKKKTIHELPEQIQKQKRAKWREATRRSRARKKSHFAQWTEPL